MEICQNDNPGHPFLLPTIHLDEHSSLYHCYPDTHDPASLSPPLLKLMRISCVSTIDLLREKSHNQTDKDRDILHFLNTVLLSFSPSDTHTQLYIRDIESYRNL
ncbi:hypothetical protein BJV82DRAFT_614274 [Fennellomyces sp. T-0311]|nr:hypothetical protein BJV82DRAFT_614274 [Fennellomyces sp. T-0311]